MLAFATGPCHSRAVLRGKFRHLCQTDTGNHGARPRLDLHYAVDWQYAAGTVPPLS